jgi:inner membrane protein
MLITFGLKYVVHEKFKDSLESSNIEYTELNSTPTILNSILWSAIAFNDSVLYVSEYSFLKKDEPINWISFDRNQHLISTFDSPALQTIKWFSDGNYFMQTMEGDTLAFYNVKFGRMRFDTSKPEDTFFFFWKFYIENDEVKYAEVRREDWSFKEAFAMLMERIGVK